MPYVVRNVLNNQMVKQMLQFTGLLVVCKTMNSVGASNHHPRRWLFYQQILFISHWGFIPIVTNIIWILIIVMHADFCFSKLLYNSTFRHFCYIMFCVISTLSIILLGLLLQVNEPCKLEFVCQRTPIYIGGRYLKVC